MSKVQFSNISAYRFVDLEEEWIQTWRTGIREECVSRDLAGTILLSPEGTNVSLCGRPDSVREFWSLFTSLPAFAGLTYKETFSDRQTFNRMLVKIKKEIIAFGQPDIRPALSTSKRIAPRELKRWLDEGRDVVLLDTRNDFEFDLGTFRKALDLDIESFRSFPDAARRLDDHLRDRPVVTFCTGGIRCEKAAPYLESLGFSDVYQLDGGILQYFTECGGEHWEGECFVFDQRVALDSRLEETDTEYCFNCQHVLRPSDMESPLFRLGSSCPYCAE